MIFEKQAHQQECVENIIKILKPFDFATHSNLNECLATFYKENRAINVGTSPNKNLDILMETGTGKTFTYINAIYEIHKTYHQNKFIIFVPRKAILESVKQNLKLTKDYFYSIYKTHLKVYEYKDEKSIKNIITHYIKSQNDLSVLLLTSSAINKKGNLLNQSQETLFSKNSILENIASLRPISFIDEPHLLKGEKFKEYFSKIDSLYFRFGATFPTTNDDKLSNLIYSLDSISAFKNYLVKQISVNTIIDESFKPILRSIDQKTKTATFELFLDGIARKVDVKTDEDLGLKLEDESLKGVYINSIKSKKLYLSNKQIIEESKNYSLSPTQISTLLKKAIELHFEKEERLFKENIKSLSLFFIPNISDFRGDNPYIKKEFERLYKIKRKEILQNQNLDKNYRAYLEKDFDKDGNLQVMNGYFSGDSHQKSGSTVEDKEAGDIKLILEEKEKLLSFKTPLRFIFSVWALQEGWDNPNIFTLTKLASSATETSKRQQVGRGLRLALNQSGKRITQSTNSHNFYDINLLDVVINANEGAFIADLQKEINSSSFSFDEAHIKSSDLFMLDERAKSRLLVCLEDRGALEFDAQNDTYKVSKPLFEMCKDDEKVKEIVGDKFSEFLSFIKPSQNKAAQLIDNNLKQQTTAIKSDLALKFKELWQSINANATIRYDGIDSKALISEIATKFDATSIPPKKVKVFKETFIAQENRIEKNETIFFNYELGDNFILENIKEFVITSGYPFKFIMQIYNTIKNRQNFKNDSKLAFIQLDNIIKDSVHKNIIKKISYDFNSTNITTKAPFNYLYDADGLPKKEIATNKLGRYLSEKTKSNYLYDRAVYDSNIEKEIIEKEADSFGSNKVTVFAKLPKFSIPTPYKEYEPDFAYLIENNRGKKIFFICETKGYDNYDDISINERQKIDYAKLFFKALNEQVKREGKNVEVIFKTRINRQNLIDILGELR